LQAWVDTTKQEIDRERMRNEERKIEREREQGMISLSERENREREGQKRPIFTENFTHLIRQTFVTGLNVLAKNRRN